MRKILFLLTIYLLTAASAGAQDFDSRFFNNQFVAAGGGLTLYNHDAGLGQGANWDIAYGNWILKDIALRFDFGLATAENARGYTSRFVNAHCDFLWDVEGAISGVFSPRRGFAFYPEVGFGFLDRLAIETANGQQLRYDVDFMAMVGAMLKLRSSRLKEWPLFIEGRMFLLPQSYDFNRQMSQLWSLSFGLQHEIRYDPTHKRLKGESEEWSNDWYYGAGAGANYSVMDIENEEVTAGRRLGWDVDLTLGRNLSSLWAFRLGLYAMSGTTDRVSDKEVDPKDFDYAFCGARADLMLNASNLFGASGKWQVIPYAGCGVISRFDYPRVLMGADGGLMLRHNFNEHLDLYADVRYMMVPPRFNGGRHMLDNGFIIANFGILYNFNTSIRRACL